MSNCIELFAPIGVLVVSFIEFQLQFDIKIFFIIKFKMH